MEYWTFILAIALLAPGLSLEGYEDEIHSLLSPALHHYDTLHPHHITHTLHGDHSHPSHARVVQFSALGREFKLYLKPHTRLFSPGFRVQSRDRNGRQQFHEINITEYYLGHLDGDENSVVSVHVSEAGVLTGSVKTPSEMFHFEPSDHFLARPHPLHTICYKSSDVKDRLGDSKLDFVVAPPLPPEVPTGTKETTKYSQHKNGSTVQGSQYNINYRDSPSVHQRAKRQYPGAIGGDSCRMALVADHLFYDRFSGSGEDADSAIAGIARRLVSLVSDIDSMIYQRTEWIVDLVDDETVSNIGLEIAEVIIHTEPNSDDFSTNPREYYNSGECCRDVDSERSSTKTASNLLTAFNYGNWGDYCLAHLFTYFEFPSGLLGLANIASSFRSQTGGICSRDFTDSDTRQRIIYNTGLSTFLSGNNPLIRKEQLLVTAHEVGHNWGSHHDPGNRPDCRNNFLMNEFAQDGSRASHMQFSECSRTSIGVVLESKGGCFQDRSACGNYLIDDEDEEECDEGPVGGACCTNNCTLKSFAQCSDTNKDCCMDCSVVPANSVVCRDAGAFTSDCSTDVFCDGASFDCPNISTVGTAPEMSECSLGVCQFSETLNLTVCVDICEANVQTSCRCSSEEDECFVCCSSGDGNCEPGLRNESNVFRPTGATCSGGACIRGVCRANQDTISRIFSIITNLDIDDLVLFMRENIVGFTLIFSVILWVPMSLTIYCCYDRKIWKKLKKDYTDHVMRMGMWLPLVQEYGELGSRSTSPIDDTPHPTYSSTRLEPISEDVEPESDPDMDGMERAMID